MKLTAILLTVAFVHAYASGTAQKVTLSCKNIPLKQVFTAIEQQTGFVVFNNKGLLSDTKPVSLSVQDMPLVDFLEVVFEDQPLEYVIQDRTIFISRRGSKGSKSMFVSMGPITGRVTDSVKAPLAGATVSIRGKTVTAVTDEAGRFTIDAEAGDMLVVSFVGFERKVVIIKDNDRELIISLTPSETSLEEVTVSTGYWTSTKRKSLGNISKVDGKDIKNLPVSSLMNALVGRVPGVDITLRNGATAAAPAIQIRGNNSLNINGSYPLYVIDGAQIDSRPLRSSALSLYAGGFDPLSTISPSDIESIEILKDAVATAIYGSRGANGVVRITTKRAKYVAKSNFDLDVYSGIGKVPNRVELLNREQYLEMRHEAFANDNATPNIFLHPDMTGIWDTTRSTDWQKVLLSGTAKFTNIQGVFSGGNAQNFFRIGGGYYKESTVFPGDFGFQRANSELSFNHSSRNNRFKILASVNFGWVKNRNYDAYDYVGLALELPPVAPKLYNDDGTLNWQIHQYLPTYTASSWSNPLAGLLIATESVTNNLLSNIIFDYKLSSHLNAKVSISYANTFGNEIIESPVAARKPENRLNSSGASAYFNSNNRRSFIIEPQIIYTRNIKGHNINATIGTTWQNRNLEYRSILALDYPSDAFLGSISGAEKIMTAADENSQYRYASIYARIGYDHKGRYLLDLVARRDGSSRFGPGKRYGNFGAIGLGWIFSDETFADNSKVLSFGKIRGSYGITGNDQIGDYKYLNTFSKLTFGYNNGVSIAPTSLFNPNYAWEYTRKLEIGIELGFMDNRIMLEGVWYRNRSSNQLVNAPIAATTGFSSLLENFDATIQNTGAEISASTVNIKSEKLEWSTSFNLSIPRNKLVKFDGIEATPYATMYIVGEPLSIQRRYTFKGLNPATGLFETEDLNGDGRVNSLDLRFTNPLGRSMYYGLNNRFAVGNLELSFLFQFSSSRNSRYLPNRLPGTMYNQMVEVLDRWQKPGDDALYQRYISTYDDNYSGRIVPSNRSYGSNSFARLKNLSLNYRFPDRIARKAHLENCSFFIQGQNIFTITKFKGLDPETGNNLPPLRTITAGLQCKL